MTPPSPSDSDHTVDVTVAIQGVDRAEFALCRANQFWESCAFRYRWGSTPHAWTLEPRAGPPHQPVRMYGDLYGGTVEQYVLAAPSPALACLLRPKEPSHTHTHTITSPGIPFGSAVLWRMCLRSSTLTQWWIIGEARWWCASRLKMSALGATTFP